MSKAEIWFYRCNDVSLLNVVAPLLAKTLQADKRALICVSDQGALRAFDDLLWDAPFWLPHGSNDSVAKPEWESEQPIYLTDCASNVNHAKYAFRINGAQCPDLNGFERVFDVFSGVDQSALQAARKRWVELRDQGFSLSYWSQDEQGKWNRQNF